MHTKSASGVIARAIDPGILESLAAPTMVPDIKPFKIAVPDSAIAALKAKLAKAAYPDQVDFSDDWTYGAARNDVRRLAKHWEDTFDWRAQEQKLNKLPHYMTKISVDGFEPLDIHFLHQRSSQPNAIPLLFVHGCECRRPYPAVELN